MNAVTHIPGACASVSEAEGCGLWGCGWDGFSVQCGGSGVLPGEIGKRAEYTLEPWSSKGTRPAAPTHPGRWEGNDQI